ncbi:MAG TPA: DUF1549 and DUF1553 domain-containing protein, partial [Gemmataceae bacterium]
MFLPRRPCLTLVPLFALAIADSRPAAAAEPADRDAVIGRPAALEVQPAQVTLADARDVRQLVVTGRYADGSVRDLTPYATVEPRQPGLVEVGTNGFLSPRAEGSTVLVIRAGDQRVEVPVTVGKMDPPRPVSFRHDVIAALNVGGCNAGACHGTPSGKNGFRLSLRGYDPASDYIQLTRDVFGRRTDRLNPAASLILKKGLGQVPHEGGQRFPPSSVAARMLTGWLSEGLRDDPKELPALARVEVLPGPRVLRAPADRQQLAVVAHFADGTARDVTRLTVFSSSDPAVADVDANGLVRFAQSGEVAVLCRYLEELVSVRLTYLEPRPDFVWADPPEYNYVDKFVFAKLKQMGINPSGLCTDEEFIRRASLDLCGVLPTPEEVKAFLNDDSKDKRAKLIDRLLGRPEYADFWTLKWSDVFRSSRKTVELKGAHAFRQWLRAHVVRNTPFDAVVTELLTAEGNTFRNPAANYFRIARAPEDLAETTAQLFLGVRMQCAKCHNHPFERWTQDDYYSLAAFFARVKQKKDPADPKARDNFAEVIFVRRDGEVVQPRTGKAMAPRFPGGEPADVSAHGDRRAALAGWLTDPKNPFFARSVVNRVWYHLTGRGIVDPVDDFRDSNPPANDELLAALADDFAKNNFDLKRLIRTVMNSRTYQLSAEPNETNAADEKYFSHAVTKLLTAEQLLDALCDVTGVPEKYPGLPAGTRAIQLPDGEVNNPFLKTFGQPARELACECERETDSNLAQALQLINGPTINDKIRRPDNRLGKLLAANLSDNEVLNEIYLAALARLPLAEER